MAGRRGRLPGHIGRHRRTDHLGGYGFPLGPADRRRLPARRPETDPETADDLRSAVRRGLHHPARQFLRTVALLCLVQPDAGRLHAMGADGLSDPETQTVRYHADPRAVHDGRLLDLYPDRTGGTAPAARTGLLARRSRYPVHIRPVPRVAQQIPAAEPDDLTGTDHQSNEKGFSDRIVLRIVQQVDKRLVALFLLG